ncbi:MAG: hypothetical protein JWQ71_3483 [Pedosphaera sp.]|nr:hypothetical protein [Pedosphaera sp.]
MPVKRGFTSAFYINRIKPTSREQGRFRGGFVILQNFQNILVIKFKSMGDVIFTLPAVNMLRENFPDARITFLTSAENRAIVEQFPSVDEVLVIDRTLFKKPRLKTITSTFGLLRRLRQGKFSLVIDLQHYAETAWLTRWTGAPQRWAWTLKDKFRGRAYTHVRPRQDQLHPVDISLDLLTHCGLKLGTPCNRLRISERGRAEAQQFLKENKLNPGLPIFIFQPFTSAAPKNWPFENYLVIANHWKERGIQIIFSGGNKERDLFAPAQAAGFPICIGAPLSTVTWLINQSTIVVGGDTGLLHLAVALGKRVLMLMARAGTRTPVPYEHPEWVIWPPETNNLPNIKIETVNQAIEKALVPGMSTSHV